MFYFSKMKGVRISERESSKNHHERKDKAEGHDKFYMDIIDSEANRKKNNQNTYSIDDGLDGDE